MQLQQGDNNGRVILKMVEMCSYIFPSVSRATERSGDQYVFSSAPSVPREKAPDILVKFQAVSREHPCLRSCSLYVSSKSSLLEIRKLIYRTFAQCYEKGFIFLRKNKEVVRSRERILRLFDILPRPPSKVQNPAFRYQNVQYKKVTLIKKCTYEPSLCYMFNFFSDG